MGAGKSCNVCRISIHALLAESDAQAQTGAQFSQHFYPRSPCGERHSLHRLSGSSSSFLSTLSLRRATEGTMATLTGTNISIHALLAESDPYVLPVPRPPQIFLSTLSLRRATIRPDCLQLGKTYFYPRSPCGERRYINLEDKQVSLFLSTLSLRRATPTAMLFTFLSFHFYPRSPCGERPD